MDGYKIGVATLVSGLALTVYLPKPADAGALADVYAAGTFDVTASPAPNFFGSPSYSAWNSNAITALENGLSSYGNPTLPSYYYQTTTGTDRSNIVSSFPSWNGEANPTGAFASELGNRLTFNLVATAPTGGTIQLAGLQATMTSSDPGDTLGFSTSWSSASSYNQYTIGLIFNGSGTHVVDTGPATQAVDELIVVGLGNAIPAAASNPTCAGAGSDQAQLDCVAGQYDALIPFNVTTTFTLGGQTASDTVDFVPEPGTLTLFGSAVAGLGVLRRRRKRG